MPARRPSARPPRLLAAAPFPVLLTVSLSLIAGCGGSGGSSPAGIASGTERTFGPFLTRAEGTTQAPVVQRSESGVITGIAGATFTSVINRSSATPAPAPGEWSGIRFVMSSLQFGKEAIFVSKIPNPNNPSLDFLRLTDASSTNTLPAWSPDGKQIAFVSDRDGNQEIYVMNADGTNVRRLTNSAAIDSEPAWSPDGTKIAFTSRRSGNSEIFVMNPDGSNPVNVTNDAGDDRFPAWSPDSKALVFSSNRTGNYDLWRIYADGTQKKNLTNTTDSDELEATVRGDGNIFAGYSLVFVRRGLAAGSFRQLWSMDSEGGNELNYFPNTEINHYRPHYAPVANSGNSFTFVSDNEGRNLEASVSSQYAGSERLVADGVQTIAISPYHTVQIPPAPTPTPSPLVRTLVGNGGNVASACAGFLYGMRLADTPRDNAGLDVDFTSFVAIDTVSAGRNDLRIASILPESPDSSALYGTGIMIFSATAGANKITTLRYLNARENKVAYAVGDGGSAAATGVLLYFNPTNGEVDTVLPYNATKSVGGTPTVTRQGDILTLRGHFTGRFDSAGNNLAPDGLTQIKIHRITGKILP